MKIPKIIIKSHYDKQDIQWPIGFIRIGVYRGIRIYWGLGYDTAIYWRIL